MVIRRIARPLLSVAFIGQGVNSLLNPKSAAQAAAPAVDGLQSLPDPLGSSIPSDPETVARITAAVQVGGGLLLATGKTAAHRLGRARVDGAPGQPRDALVLERTRPGAQRPEAPAISHRPQPGRRIVDCVGRHRGQTLAGMARPPGRRAAVRAGVLGAAGLRRRPTSRNSARRSCTACRSAPNAAANSPAPPPKEAHPTPKPRSNGAANWPARPPNGGAPLAKKARKRGEELASTAADKSAPLAKKARKRSEKLAKKARKRGEELADLARERGVDFAEPPYGRVRRHGVHATSGRCRPRASRRRSQTSPSSAPLVIAAASARKASMTS